MNQDKLSQIKAKRMTVEDVRPGAIGYYVFVCAERTQVHEMHFTSMPFPHASSLWAYIANTGISWGVTDNDDLEMTSLRDQGIFPNEYNNHLTFKTREDAEAYASYCREENVPSCVSMSPFGHRAI